MTHQTVCPVHVRHIGRVEQTHLQCPLAHVNWRSVSVTLKFGTVKIEDQMLEQLAKREGTLLSYFWETLAVYSLDTCMYHLQLPTLRALLQIAFCRINTSILIKLPFLVHKVKWKCGPDQILKWLSRQSDRRMYYLSLIGIYKTSLR
jgi:hypothetical protein